MKILFTLIVTEGPSGVSRQFPPPSHTPPYTRLEGVFHSDMKRLTVSLPEKRLTKLCQDLQTSSSASPCCHAGSCPLELGSQIPPCPGGHQRRRFYAGRPPASASGRKATGSGGGPLPQPCRGHPPASIPPLEVGRMRKEKAHWL